MWRRAFYVWLLIVLAESLHGTLREVYIKPLIGDFAARQIGVLVGSMIIFIIALISVRWIGAKSNNAQFQIGILWVLLIILFELGLGKILGYSNSRIFQDYNILHGGYMGLGLVFMLFAPMLAAKIRNLKT